MSYQVIARKWRPQSFNEVVGQNHITQTLTNALKNNRLHHAILLTGPRGTGKTTSARILAKAIRCPNAVDFVPCDKCDSCLEIAQSRSSDVIELDGASNNGVDAIRDLRDSVGYMPSSGKYKVYIIDEVHMLSTSAFNALLKTLEEPPEHVVFIMATTEVQKIPQTILSRCQRYDFRRIPIKQITDQLKKICEGENVPAEEDALWMIARQGDGSMRDSLSLLDQVITFANGPLTRLNVVEILGLTSRTLLFETLESLIARDTKAVMKVLEKIATSGFEPHLFSQDLLEVIRNLLLVKVSGQEAMQILELPDSEFNALGDLAKKSSEEDLHMLFDMALKGGNDIPKAQDPRIVLEVSLLRMAAAPQITDLESLLRGGARLGVKASAGPKKASAQVTKVQEGPKYVTGPNLHEKWLAFVHKVRQDEALFAAKTENLLFVKEDGTVIHLGVPPKLAFLKEQMNDSTIRAKLQGFIDSYWGAGYSFQVLSGRDPIEGESANTLLQKKSQQAEDEIRKQINENPMVIAAQKAFKGQIKAVTEIAEKGRR
ncbi:DNA polymerase III subunit gamma/tau [Bdellovibrio sp. HCB337]|uniref:DNA polymerase III subunit gamma/tau n=1 Tax=Bdellovibrio sp. HCB337 TaxID=3394358 RepID=UPI0039A6291E